MVESITKLRNTIISFCYKHIAKPIFFSMDPEVTHDHATKAGIFFGSNPITNVITKIFFHYSHPMLEQNVAGIHFKNPVGLAAGFDKDAQLTNTIEAVGFGFEELGSITGEYCAGNPKPRLWRLKQSKSIVVYYGLKNQGAQILAARLRSKIKKKTKNKSSPFPFPVGISAAKTNCKETIPLKAGIEDYIKVFHNFRDIGDYYTINISCPNSFGGEDFADPKKLKLLLREIKKEKLFHKPIFIKLSPDLTTTRLDEIIDLALEFNLAGLISSNLIKDRNHATSLTNEEKDIWKKGGISGKPVKAYSLKLVQHIYKRNKVAKGNLVIIGCGGISNAEDAYEYICNGASLLQLITGMIFEGPQVVSEINQGLVTLLKKYGFINISQAVGSKVR
jgi:dihydroorotate dehydrogenase